MSIEPDNPEPGRWFWVSSMDRFEARGYSSLHRGYVVTDHRLRIAVFVHEFMAIEYAATLNANPELANDDRG